MNSTDQHTANVNKKITPCFNSEGLEDDPSLEEIVEQGVTEKCARYLFMS